MRVSLVQGAYEARSIIAEAQRCVNLFPEANPQGAPCPYTHYPTPGLELLSAGDSNPGRCSYRASNGELFIVTGSSVYYVDQFWNKTLLGSITYGTSPVYMQDNGLAIVIVDGSPQGWAIDLDTHSFAEIPTGAPFYGADRIDYLDTFLLLNRPGTKQWYISLPSATFAMLTSEYGSVVSGSTVGGTGYTDGTYTAYPLLGGSGAGATGSFTITGGIVGDVTIVNPGSGYVVGDSLTTSGIGAGANFAFQVQEIGGAFDPLDIASKTGYPDPIQGIICMHREIWVIGKLSTEIWYNAGAADFVFQAMPGAFVEHGTISPYTICMQDLSVYWLSLDEQGRAIFMRGAQYQAFRVSTHAVENEWATYPTVEDAVCFIYQQEGHTFVFVVFPSANKTWVFDQATELWHQRTWTDNNGNLNRHRAITTANAYNRTVCLDWQNGNLYAFDMEVFTDEVDGNGSNPDGTYPISCIRSFPHLVNDGNRISYRSFAADLEVGTTQNNAGGYTSLNSPPIYLRWSDDRGKSYGNAQPQSMGAAGQYLIQPQWMRLGIARDRVFELSWSCPQKTALNGAWVDITEALT